MTHLPTTYLTAFLLVLGSVVVSVAGLLVTRKVVHYEKLEPNHEVGGHLLAIVGTLYAVLLGLIVVDAMQQFQTARDIVERESNNLVDVYILAKELPEPRRTEVRQMCSEYAHRVIDVEWNLMQEGSYCPVARSMAVGLMEKLMDFEPKTENEKALYPQMVQEASQFWQSRQARISMADKGIPLVEWITLVVGAVITIFFTYFFGMQNLRLQMIMVGMVATLIALNLALVLMFAYPFSGDLSIQDGAFKSVLGIFAEH